MNLQPSISLLADIHRKIYIHPDNWSKVRSLSLCITAQTVVTLRFTADLYERFLVSVTMQISTRSVIMIFFKLALGENARHLNLAVRPSLLTNVLCSILIGVLFCQNGLFYRSMIMFHNSPTCKRCRISVQRLHFFKNSRP